MDEAFSQVKQMILEEIFLNYPDWSKSFDVHTNASDKQLGAVISQYGKPIAFFSQRLSKVQQNFTTIDKNFSQLWNT